MAKFNWGEITVEDVVKAIEIFNRDNPEHPEPKSTFLLFDGKKYPAKHIRGMAYKVHYNQEISKEDFSGGKETARFFEKLGFEVQYTHKKVDTHPIKKAESVVSEKVEDKAKPVKSTEMSVVSTEMNKSVKHDKKISIPAKGVIEQKNALQLLLNKICDGDIVCEKTYPWMKTPSEISGEYTELYESLKSYRGNTEFAKKNVTLRCDFVCESRKLIIEYDERQHFSEARRISLLSYSDILLNYDRQLWLDACRDIQAKDNQPANRDEIRAYYDSTRDIEAAKHGYKLIRIMHGQIDFEKEEAKEQLEKILVENESVQTEAILANIDKKPPLKIGLYLQTSELYGDQKTFDEAMDIVRDSDIDILVLPEFSYVPFDDDFITADFLNDEQVMEIYDKLLALSEDIGKAIVICNEDEYGTIMSFFANAYAEDGETICKDYIKHTMTKYSACEIENYSQYAQDVFEPILFKGWRIGLTICYDCNHAIFSRKYGLNDVDMILNSTGGDVVYDKWNKYNKARAIENDCFTFVTMGGDGEKKNPHCYVYGFTPQGKEMHPALLNGADNGDRNCPGGIYVYDTTEDDGQAEFDPSVNQAETVNKKNDIFIPVDNIDAFISQGKKLSEHLYVWKTAGVNVVMCLVDDEDIMLPEKVLKLLYADELKSIDNKRYVIINRWNKVDNDFYETKLSLLLKVRAMENYCAVILSSGNINKAYQCGQNRTAQVVKAVDGEFGIDLARTGGPDVIWKDKQGMKESWRKNIKWLVESM